MNIQFDKYNQAEAYRIYLCDISGNFLCALNGIQEDSVSLTCKLNNAYELSFSVDRWLEIHEKKIESNGYQLLDEFMRLYVEHVGWFIMSAPTVSHDGNQESLDVNAQSIETELTHNDLRGFKVNYASSDSIEMLVPENVEQLKEIAVPKEQVRFCNPEKPELSLLHMILKFADVKGWSIGYVDEIPKVYQAYENGKLIERTVQLKDEIGRFDIDNQNVYAFLTQDIEQFFQCIISFDIQKMTINAYRPEHIGKDTSVTLGFRNVQNSNSISVDEDSIYTRYRVSGDDSLSIRSVNFGSDMIENLSYFMNTKYLPPEVISKYQAWKSDVESKRYEYIDAARKYSRQLNVLTELLDRVPLDDCSTEWTKFSDEKLVEAKDNYTAQKAGYESFYLDENGKFDEGKLAKSPDADDYFQIRDVILANIQIEIDNRKLETSVGHKESVKTYKTDWKLYGIDELQVNLDFYKTEIKHLKESHFDLSYTMYQQQTQNNPEVYPPHTRDAHEIQHALYLDYQIQLDKTTVGSLANTYDKRVSEYTAAEALSETYLSEMTAIAKSVEKEHWSQKGIEAFTQKELAALSKLYKDTDYTNKNMFITDLDDQAAQIDEELKLLQAAEADLDSGSQPQYVYRTSLDNFLTSCDYRQYTESLELGDFLYLAVSDESLVKLRLVSYSFNPAAMDNDLQINFSNMIRTKAQRYDISYLLNLGGGSSKNSISGGSQNFNKKENLSITQSLLNKLLSSSQYTNTVENLINQHFQSLIGQLVITKGLEAEMIKATKLEAKDGFFQYLQTALIAADEIVSESGIFGKLHATVGAIDALLSGNISAELGHIIRLTAENVSVDEAFIRDLVAAQISVSMLKAGDITLGNHMQILSENGYMSMNGQTLQIKGIKENGEEYVAIQLGYSAAGKPALIVCDEAGSVMLDAKGLHESIIPDGFIQSDMIGKGQIEKGHLAFQTIETDEDGNIDASKVVIDGKGLQAEFSSIAQEVTRIDTRTDTLSAAVDSIVDATAPYSGDITSSKGMIFDKSGEITSTELTAHVYQGKEELLPDTYTVNWYQRMDNGELDMFSEANPVTIPLHTFETSNDIYFEFALMEDEGSETV